MGPPYSGVCLFTFMKAKNCSCDYMFFNDVFICSGYGSNEDGPWEGWGCCGSLDEDAISVYEIVPAAWDQETKGNEDVTKKCETK